MRPPPNLRDPAEFAVYRQELRGVARPIRLLGVGLMVLGAALLLVRRFALPAMPLWPILLVLAFALFNIVAAAAARAKYHQKRMRPDG